MLTIDKRSLVVVSHMLLSFSQANGVQKVIANWPITHSGMASYPTSFTQDIIPKPIASHNDYWRKVPFYSALELGCISVESDVWLYNEELYVGHDTSALTRNRTFQSLYVYPILDTLGKMNPKTDFVNSSRNGVFDVDPLQTLYLWIDIKTNGIKTWPYIYKQLEPLRAANYLTYFDGTQIVPGPVTVMGTGNSPFDLMMKNQTYRDYFIDAPLEKLGTDKEPLSKTGKPLYTKYTSPIASTDFRTNVGFVLARITDAQKALVRRQIAAATARGIEVRYWNTPSFPVGRRNMVWRFLTDEGAGLLNVDDIKSAAFNAW